LTPAQQQTYLNGLREWELAANVQFIPRTTQAQYVFFKYDPAGPNRVSASNPQVVEINQLTRGQICHEMGHSFGLLHEHVRGDRDTYVSVLTANIAAADQHWFEIDPNGTAQGAYDFESVMHFSRNLFSVNPATLDTLLANSPYERFQPRMGGFALSKGDRAVMKYLYGTGPILSPVVTNTSETGVGSLRAAIHYATDNPGTTITFNIPTTDPGYANGVFKIRLTGHLLPLVVDGTIIDGTAQPGYAGSPVIVLEGSKILPEAGSVPGLFIYAASAAVKGLAFQRFPWVGLAILFPDANHNAIRACRFGLDDSGAASAPNYQGIFISSGANFNTIGGTTAADRNVISGNSQYGVWISGPTTTGNVTLGNYIGTSPDGLGAVQNGFGGIIVTDGAHDNTIGGTSAGARNIISGNVNAGVWLTGLGVNGNVVRGNYIGLATTGAAAVPNTFAGLNILNGAKNNLVADNVISGNATEGLRIANAGTAGNMVQGNRVGIAPASNTALGNGFAGIAIYAGATGNLVGGTTAGQRNTISGNGTVGLVFGDGGTSGNIAQGNFIGTDPSGTASIGNGFAGVYLIGGTSANYLGGVQPGTGNLISGNSGYGVFVADSGTNGNFIRGNFIGTDITGTAALPNAFSGISIFNGAANNVVGDAIGGRNVISGNANYGIIIADAGTTANLVRGNTIGMNAAGITSVSNGWQGIAIQGGATLNQIGGTASGQSNLIAGNILDGIVLYDAATRRNTISANSIHDNGGVGIARTGISNDSIAAPVITSAVLGPAGNPGGTDIFFTPTGNGATSFRIEFFANLPGEDEGRFFVGAANGPGGAALSISLPAAVPKDYLITATATDPIGNTSELSATRAVTTTDTDSDGIPDAFETNNGLNASISDAALDKDGDGMSNLQEFRAGTDPQVTTSRFRISAFAKSGTDLNLTFASVPGKTYRVEAKDNLPQATWILLEDQIFATSASTQITDLGAGVLPRRFYRASVEP